MLSRRDFIQSASLTGTAFFLKPFNNLGRYLNNLSPYFGLNTFIENNPDAVFIIKTNIQKKTDSIDIKSLGLQFGRTIFIPKEQGQSTFPLTTNIVFKPNLTQRGKWQPRTYTIEGSMGIVTDCYFIEGLINSLKELNVKNDNIFIRESKYILDDIKDSGYIDMVARTGINLKDTSAKIGVISESDLHWLDVPKGVWFNKIPYLWPINSPGSVLVNVAKFKAHSMGLTLCAKNIQGTIAENYVRHCTTYGSEADMDMLPGHMNPDANLNILQNYEKHKSKGIPRWDRPGLLGGLWQETWATRCLDNNSICEPLINIIEGIYGRDGDFLDGPGPDNLALDYMTNVLIFGKNSFHVDIIGNYLGGHEPGNFGLFHMAKERGLSSFLNPNDVPLFEWKLDGSATQALLSNFLITPLKTLYLRRDYNGQSEDYWHLVNEPYNYEKSSFEDNKNKIPDVFILSQNYPNPFNPSTSIEFKIPENGNVHLDIIDVQGKIIDILADKYFPAGSHLVVWNNNRVSSGLYFYRLFFKGFIKQKKMILIR